MLLAFLPHIVFLNDLKEKKQPPILTRNGHAAKKKLSIKSGNAIFFLFAPLFVLKIIPSALQRNCLLIV